jgi:hypothetical protein
MILIFHDEIKANKMMEDEKNFLRKSTNTIPVIVSFINLNETKTI